MKKIDTSVVTSSSLMPGLANGAVQTGIDFLQQALLDTGGALGVALTSNGSYPCILYGCVLTGSSMSAGWIYAGTTNEIYYVPAQTITGSGSYIAVNINPNPTDISPNQTVMSDGTLVSIHNQRTIVLTYASSPNTGALTDYGTWLPTNLVLALDNIASLNGQVNTIIGNSWVGLSYQNSWADTGGAYNAGRCRNENGYGVLSGNMQGGTTGTVCFTLPAGIRPAQRVDFAISTYSDYGAYISILNTGVCTIHFDSGATTFSLEGIRFPLN